jgi:hypothetical protein
MVGPEPAGSTLAPVFSTSTLLCLQLLTNSVHQDFILGLVTSQRPHLQTPSYSGLDFNMWMWRKHVTLAHPTDMLAQKFRFKPRFSFCFFETGSYYVTQPNLQLTMEPMLAWSLQSSCLSLLCAGITDRCAPPHPAWFSNQKNETYRYALFCSYIITITGALDIAVDFFQGDWGGTRN